MAVTQADIDNLNTAIASGARSVTLGGQTIVYGTTESLIKARDDLKAQLGAQQATTRRPRQSQAIYAGRGYD
ncbi:head-tail adaptor protein [Acidovorax phage ACF1]|nr:head-tail adaptor protein [Acidovorax phage ACF1]